MLAVKEIVLENHIFLPTVTIIFSSLVFMKTGFHKPTVQVKIPVDNHETTSGILYVTETRD